MRGIEPERQIAQAVVAYRSTTGMTVEQLSEAVGIPRADIIRLEEGTPSAHGETRGKV